ncbi:MCE family protein [Actinomadura rupiterrae]|uniref:MCE family protein n=1 Tax=Actinomadura rupiterrae TaxID=559627 RepID=UPI0020A559EE|nr:MCE family protein [Actinomadura rupiterrae]MCP2334835.1 phospholipid/cholesterol/gamma-HCH transport system substrate-binding protein [Actinomadura rupiterrae]
MARSTTLQTLEKRVLGIAFLLVPALLIWLSIAIYDKRFTKVTMVTLHTSTAGHEMHEQADVKVRGVVVGEVRTIRSEGNGAVLKLALNPDKARFVPSDVQAQLLPTTVFGARFVSLVPPPGSTASPVHDGSQINEDHSQNAVELSQVLNNTMALLNTLQPAKLSATLNAMSTALEGRGDQLGRNFVQLDSYLKKLNPDVPALSENFRQLATFSQNWADASPDLLNALTDFASTSRTIVDQRQNLSSLFDTTGQAADDLGDFFRRNGGNMIALSTESRASLDLLRRYAPAAPCTFRALADFIPQMDRVMGKGTDRHGVHAIVVSVQNKGRYEPGKDAVHYGPGGGPRCYSAPYYPGGGKSPKAVRVGAPTAGAVPGSGLGPANSASENDLVNEFVAPSMDQVPDQLPDWSSVLVGPIYRGTEVTVK